ncbi:MAG: hypothetical protein ABJ275_02870 [Maricaulaceae bacterium]
MKHVLVGLILFGYSFQYNQAFASSDIERSGERIGRWCDTAIPAMPEQDYIIEIWKSANGGYSYHQIFKTKTSDIPSMNSYVAKKIKGSWQIQSGFGEYARIGDDGGLKIYDGQGFIRKAIPVGPWAKPGECRTIPPR